MVYAFFTIILTLFALSIPVAAVIFGVGLMLDYFYSPMDVFRSIGEIAWTTSTNSLLTSIPLFILMGEIMLRAGVAERMYEAINHWVAWLPGGLMHSNIGASTMFAATSGSSVATAATISTVALPQMNKRGYNPRLFMGSIAAGGTIGILIPPSIILIVYGTLTQTSIPKLYLAGFVPGLLLAASFSAIVLTLCLLVPRFSGRRISSTWSQRVYGLPDLLPPLFIFLIVVGSIYAGIATPTEGASLGVVAVLALAAFARRLSLSMILESVEGTLRITAMIMLIVIAAAFLNFVLTMVGFSQSLTEAIRSTGLSPHQTLFLIILFYLILGCFMESMAMLVTTVPIVVPVIVQLGFDPIWFGIIVILLVEMALITPPVGMNLYVVQGVRGRGQIQDIMIGVAPFIVALAIVLLLTVFFPGVALWLPAVMSN